MDQEETFNTLKRAPFNQMYRKLINPYRDVSDMIPRDIEYIKYYPELFDNPVGAILEHTKRHTQVLNDNNWSVEDFIQEIKKRFP